MTGQDVVDFIARRGGGVTFVEIRNFLDGNGVETKGDLAMTLGPSGSNVLLWFNMSETFCDLMDVVMRETDMAASNWLVYMMDGEMIKMPIAKRIPKNGYRKEHWCPVVFWESGRCPR